MLEIELAILVGLVKELIGEARKSKISFKMSSHSIPLCSTMSYITHNIKK